MESRRSQWRQSADSQKKITNWIKILLKRKGDSQTAITFSLSQIYPVLINKPPLAQAIQIPPQNLAGKNNQIHQDQARLKQLFLCS